jgi:hypothetical protein
VANLLSFVWIRDVLVVVLSLGVDIITSSVVILALSTNNACVMLEKTNT